MERSDVDERELPNVSYMVRRAQGHVNANLNAYLDLVGDNAPGAKRDTDFLRPLRIEVAQPKVTYLASRADTEEVLHRGEVASIPVVLPKELPAPGTPRSITRSQ